MATMTDREYTQILSRLESIEDKVVKAIEAGAEHRLELERRISDVEGKVKALEAQGNFAKWAVSVAMTVLGSSTVATLLLVLLR